MRSASLSSPGEIQRAGLMAMQVLRGRRILFWHKEPDPDTLKRSLREIIGLAKEVDLSRATLEDFDKVEEVLGRLIDKLERYVAGLAADPAECGILMGIIEDLRSIRYWLVRGLSPDPAKRPTPAQLERMANERALSTLNELANRRPEEPTCA